MAVNEQELNGFPDLLLRPPFASDLDAVRRLLGDPRTGRYTPAGPVLNPVESERMLHQWIDDWTVRGIGYWLIEDRDRKQPIGWAGVRFIAVGDQDLLNLAYRTDPGYWDRGIASAVAVQACVAAHSHHRSVPVIARTAMENIAAVRTAEKAGLRTLGFDRWGWQLLADRDISDQVLDLLPLP